MKILIVDDELHIPQLYKEELEEEGYEVISAGTGRKALRLFEKEDPDIVTLDILMPDVSGKRLLRKMKEQRPKTPVIISTAYDYKNNFDILVSESDEFIVKSSDLSELKRERQREIYERLYFPFPVMH